ncbi:MAG: hypothetical protein U1C53_02115, partial [Candidatus Veblenbacteria bacterium]|nr:hypothetical protein [Candidatus Veblenbacteria bacterium]
MLARRGPSKKKILILGGTIGLVWVTIGVVVYRSFVAKPAPQPAPAVVVPVGSSPVEPGTAL